jgi:hypothetical protein
MTWRYILAWLPGIPIAIANGSLRQFVIRKYVGELTAHQISVVSFVLLFGLYVWLALPWLRLASGAEATRVGLVWLGLTIAFEFVFGHYVMGHPWALLRHDYNLLQGRLWVVALAWTTLAPYVCFQLRHAGA